MTYLKVVWKSDLPHMPVELFSELDAERYEVRKVELFRSGKLQFAGPQSSSGETCLGENPVPAEEVIARNPKFTICPLDAHEFELMWQGATVSRAA